MRVAMLIDLSLRTQKGIIARMNDSAAQSRAHSMIHSIVLFDPRERPLPCA